MIVGVFLLIAVVFTFVEDYFTKPKPLMTPVPDNFGTAASYNAQSSSVTIPIDTPKSHNQSNGHSHTIDQSSQSDSEGEELETTSLIASKGR